MLQTKEVFILTPVIPLAQTKILQVVELIATPVSITVLFHNYLIPMAMVHLVVIQDRVY